MRVHAIRDFTVREMCVLLSDFVNSGDSSPRGVAHHSVNGSTMHCVLYAAAWITGEFAVYDKN